MRAGARCDQWNKSTDKLLMCLKSWQSSVADGSRCSFRWCWEWNSSSQPSRRAAAHFLIFESLSQGEKSRWEVNRRARRRKQTTKHCERDWFECARWLSIWYRIKLFFRCLLFVSISIISEAHRLTQNWKYVEWIVVGGEANLSLWRNLFTRNK